MKKLLCLTMAAVMLLLALAACNDTPEETPAPTEDPLAGMVVLMEGNKETDYTVIYADEYADNSAIKNAAKTIAYYAENLLGIKGIEVSQEYASWGVTPAEHEILIGNTQREESAEAAKLLTGAKNEYVVKLFENGKIAIVGTNNDSLKSGISHFTSSFISSEGITSIIMPIGYCHVEDLGDDDDVNWRLSSPEYEGGKHAKYTYNIGPGVSLSQNAGKMQLISETNATEFNSYLTKLTNEGYTLESKTENNGNIYASYSKAGKVTYTYYLAAFGEARVIDDFTSDTESEFEYTYTATADDTTEYYQYGMMHSPRGSGDGEEVPEGKEYGNNGAFDIIKLADNKLILIDGGYKAQATEEATAALVKFLHEITKTEEGEEITVAAWFFTHPHGDHFAFVNMLIQNYSDEIKFERVMHNLPDSSVASYNSEISALGSSLVSTYKGIKFMRLHTGQNITLGNISFDVLYTHEDVVNVETGKTNIVEANNTSTVLKFNINGKSIMYLGDWGGNGVPGEKDHEIVMERLMTPYMTAEKTYPTLEADIVQVAHHGINDNIAKVYYAIKADYAFFSQADVEYDSLFYSCYRAIIDQLRHAGINDENIYFAGRYTNGLIISADGTITPTQKQIEGVDEGYWEMLEGINPWNYQAPTA